MAKVEKTRCDQCGREVDDPYQEPGYIQIQHGNGLRGMVIHDRRDEGGQARGDTVAGDFCNMGCLAKKIVEKREERLVREATQRLEREAAVPPVGKTAFDDLLRAQAGRAQPPAEPDPDRYWHTPRYHSRVRMGDGGDI